MKSLNTGFVLIELIVAIGIMALVMMMGYQGLVTALKVEETLTESKESLRQVQRAVTIIVRDLENIAPWTVQDNGGESLAPFSLERQGATFTRTGINNPVNHPRSHFQRVSLSLTRQQTIERRHWPNVTQ